GGKSRRSSFEWNGSLGLIGAAAGAAALGAGIMFMLDPAHGQIRRSMARNQANRAAHKAPGYWQNPKNRPDSPLSQGIPGQQPSRGSVASDHLAGHSAPHFEAPTGTDEELASRVRQEVAVGCSRPMDVYVTCRSGLVS